MKQKWILEIGIFLLWTLAACTLNAEQEQVFNSQMNTYIQSINGGLTLKVVSMTQPDFVAYAKKQGPEFFKSVFATDEEATLAKSTIRRTEKKGKKIQILFQVDVDSYKERDREKQFVGISEDDGKNWFFMPYAYYKDPKICPRLTRLVS